MMTPDQKLSILLKGSYGFGKTLAACSVAIDGPVYLAYFDKNQPVELLTFFNKFRPELLDRIEYDIYSSQNPHEYLNKLMRWARDGYCPFNAVITDSATNLTSAAVNWSLGFRSRGGKTDKENKDAPALIPDFDDYKVETSLVTQALDILKNLNVINIWTAHPLNKIKLEGSGNSIKVTKTNDIVSYGSKVGSIIPGQFTEIYHFGKSIDYSVNPSRTKRFIYTDMVGDEFAKTAFDLPKEIDITDKLWWEVMKPLYAKALEVTRKDDVKTNDATPAKQETQVNQTPKYPWQK